MSTYTWQSDNLQITFVNLDQCRQVSHPGPCDLDVADLSKDPDIAKQLAAMGPEDIAKYLDGYGTWSYPELEDDAQNLQRLLWLAGSDVHESPEQYEDDES